MTTFLRRLAPILLAGWLAGCTSGLQRADRHFESGAYVQAAAAYESHLHDHPTNRHQDRALFRLALAYTLAEEPFRNSEATRSLLQELLLRYPFSSYRPQAALMLHLGEDAERERDKSDARKANADRTTRQASRWFQELELLRDEKQRGDERIAELEKELDALRREMATLGRQLAGREEKIATLERKLEELKRIDTQKIAGRFPGS